MSAKKRTASRRRFVTRLHRWLGLGSFAIVLVIALTGIALNHTESLKLDETRLTSRPVLKHYQMEPAGQPIVYAADEHLLALWDGECLFNNSVVDSAPSEAATQLIAAGKVNADEFVFVFPAHLIVCDPQGNLLDRLDSASLPQGAIHSAGSDGSEAILQMKSGDTLRLKDWLEAVPVTNENITWFSPLNEITTAQQEQLASALRGEGLPLSRVVLDLHSGRFFGWLGVLIYDLAAIALILLGISGIALWLQRR